MLKAAGKRAALVQSAACRGSSALHHVLLLQSPDSHMQKHTQLREVLLASGHFRSKDGEKTGSLSARRASGPGFRLEGLR